MLPGHSSENTAGRLFHVRGALVAVVGATLLITLLLAGVALADSYTYDNLTASAAFNNACVTRTFTVTTSFRVLDLNVGVNASNTARGQISVSLQSPAGTLVALVNNSADANANYDVLLDSASANALNDGNADTVTAPYYDRTAAPANSLNAFNDQNALGVWTMLICDNAGNPTTTFNRAQLQFSGAPLPTTTANTIKGMVFRDYNANGTLNSNEPGVAGITVTAYSAAGAAVATTTTDVTGIYTLTGLTDGQQYRLEFTGLYGNLKPGPAGTDSKTTVVFATSPSITASVGINNPTFYCDANPTLCTPIYSVYDNINGTYSRTQSVFVGIPYNSNSTTPVKSHQVPAYQLGTTYGVAWQAATGKLFASSYVKVSAGLGPNASGQATTGGIYQITPGSATTATASLFLDLQPIVGTGANPHPAPSATCTSSHPNADAGTTNRNCWLHDGGTFTQTGKLGLGDLDFNADQTLLYTVNLYKRELVEIPVGVSGTAPAPSAIVTYTIPLTACPAASDARPFALATHADDPNKMYVGVTCSAQSTQITSTLSAWVYLFDRGSQTFTAVFSTTLNYPRSRSIGNWGNCNVANCSAAWRPWQDNFASMNVVQETTPGTATSKRIPGHPQPMLTDISFDGADLLLTVRDRVADQFGNEMGNPVNSADTHFYDSWQSGDLLRACASTGGTWAWTMENNGVCGGLTGRGTGNTDGFGGGEYYYDEFDWGGNHHSELMSGGMVQIPGFSTVAVTAYDMYAYNDGSIATWSNTTGQYTTRAQLYVNDGPPTFGKANGLGDLTALCLAAPLEIGNRLWGDYNGNGIQDPGEPPLAGVVVRLYNLSGTAIATTTTDANGNYYFSSTTLGNYGPDGIANTADDASLAGLKPSSNGVTNTYQIRVDMTQITLTGLSLTQANVGTNDLRDSDGIATSTNAVITVTTGVPGANDHTSDFGFYRPVAVGDLVWFDQNGNGLADAGEPGISGVTVQLWQDTNGDGVADAQVGTTATSSSGNYTFTNLIPGNYIVHIPQSQFDLGGPLNVYSTANVVVNPNNDVNNDNNAGPANSGITGGMSSGVLVVTSTGEPPLAVDGDNTDGNLTVDFGFYPMDLGDLPDTGTGTGSGNYNTLLSDSGAAHIIWDTNHDNVPDLAGAVWLGASVDAELDGQPNSPATGDGADENGIVYAPSGWRAGQSSTLTVTVGAVGAATADVGVWIDWNNDGAFDAFYLLNNVGAGAYPITVAVPGSYVANSPVYLRARAFDPAVNPTLATGYSGLFANGEVEDYLRSFTPTAITLTRLEGQVQSSSMPWVIGGMMLSIMGMVAGWSYWRRHRVAAVQPVKK